jgi:hypothetical protein
MIDIAKVQHFSPCSKFSPPIWGDFDEEFIEIAHARQSSCGAWLCSRLIAIFSTNLAIIYEP